MKNPKAQRIGNFEVRINGPHIELISYRLNGRSIMNNAVWESGTHDILKNEAYGSVLLAGLGLGYDVHLLAANTAVHSIMVVESEKDVIDLVSESLPKDVRVVNDKILKFLNTTERKFDYIWFDVFPADPVFFQRERDILWMAGRRCLAKHGEIRFWQSHKEFEL